MGVGAAVRLKTHTLNLAAAAVQRWPCKRSCRLRGPGAAAAAAPSGGRHPQRCGVHQDARVSAGAACIGGSPSGA